MSEFAIFYINGKVQPPEAAAEGTAESVDAETMKDDGITCVTPASEPKRPDESRRAGGAKCGEH